MKNHDIGFADRQNTANKAKQALLKKAKAKDPDQRPTEELGQAYRMGIGRLRCRAARVFAVQVSVECSSSIC